MSHAIILIDLVFQNSENYYTQTFWQECKYRLKEETIKRFIIGDLSDSYSDSNFERENYSKNY